MSNQLIRPTPNVQEQSLAAAQGHSDPLFIDWGQAEGSGLVRGQKNQEREAETIFDFLPLFHAKSPAVACSAFAIRHPSRIERFCQPLYGDRPNDRRDLLL
jgi:hypothetical protein